MLVGDGGGRVLCVVEIVEHVAVFKVKAAGMLHVDVFALPSAFEWRRVDCRFEDYRIGLVGTSSTPQVVWRDSKLVVKKEVFSMCVAETDSESVRFRSARQGSVWSKTDGRGA